MNADENSERRRQLRSLAHLLDDAIPLPGGYRVGIDPLLGLIPGLGDLLSALLSVFIINEARNVGAPLNVVLRMVGNVLIDTLLGSVPLIGDLFDAAYKANTRNVDLLDRYHFDPSGTQQSSNAFVLTASIVALLLVATIVSIPVLIIVGIAKLF